MNVGKTNKFKPEGDELTTPRLFVSCRIPDQMKMEPLVEALTANSISYDDRGITFGQDLDDAAVIMLLKTRSFDTKVEIEQGVPQTWPGFSVEVSTTAALRGTTALQPPRALTQGRKCERFTSDA